VSGSVNPLRVGSNLLFVSSSGFIGINNVSPTVALDVTGAGKFSSSVSATSYNATTQNIFSVDGTERMRIGSDGTKYFGTFNSSRLQINPTGENIYSYTNGYYIYGIFNDSNSVSIESAFAGNIIFRAQAQSTSSSPTTATERMRITSGGNVGIGTSSPLFNLDISGALTSGFANVRIADSASMAANVGGGIALSGKYTTDGVVTDWGFIKGMKDNGTSGDYGGYINFYTRPNGGSFAERMRITSGGNVVIQNNKIYGTGEYLGAIWNSNGGNTTWTIGDTPANQTSWNLRVNTSAAKSGGGSWGDSSDGRLKKDIQPIQNALEEINKLNPVTFEWINPEEHNNQYNIGGFIAQEIKEIFPQFINEINAEGKDKDIVGENEIVYGLTLPFKFDAYLVKAIQELSAELTSAKQEIELLKLK
jgi:hypothetical protein